MPRRLKLIATPEPSPPQYAGQEYVYLDQDDDTVKTIDSEGTVTPLGGGGGGSFNGGTITEPLEIEAPDDVGGLLVIRLPADYSGINESFKIVDSDNNNLLAIVGGSDQPVLDLFSPAGEGVELGNASLFYSRSSVGGSPLTVWLDDAKVFEIQDDGSVHIKTGTTIQADL